MNPRFNCLLFFASLLFLSTHLNGQDKPAVFADSIANKNKNFMKDSSLLKKDTLKKAAAAAADSTPPARSHFQLNIVYESNDVYLGRTDSTVLPLVTPQISYIFKNGFEIDFNVGINVAAPSPTINSYSFDVSYSFNPGNYSGSATLTASNY